MTCNECLTYKSEDFIVLVKRAQENISTEETEVNVNWKFFTQHF
jgi:hypothetical protein